MCHAQTPEVAPNGGAVPTEAAASEETAAEESATTLVIGADGYAGISNLEGQRRFSEAFFSTNGDPSVAYLQWQHHDGASARFSLGVGESYRSADRIVNQPVEAWYQRPVGKYSVTAGKHWIPIGLQQWAQESKWGLQVQRTNEQSTFAASVNYDRVAHAPNVYFRGEHSPSESSTLGISLGAGNGVSYGSLHNKLVGLDASLVWKNWRIESEYLAAQTRSTDRFKFRYGKLTYDKNRRFKPFVAHYTWNDRSDSFGRFNGFAYGADYELTPNLVLQGGIADADERNASWLQLHYMWEKTVSRKPAFGPSSPGGVR